MDLFDTTYPITEEFDDPSDQCECDICRSTTDEEEAYLTIVTPLERDEDTHWDDHCNCDRCQGEERCGVGVTINGEPITFTYSEPIDIDDIPF